MNEIIAVHRFSEALLKQGTPIRESRNGKLF